MARRDTSIAISRVRYDQLRKVARGLAMSPREAIEAWIVQGLKDLGCDGTGVPYWVPPPLKARRVVVDMHEFVAIEAKGWPLTLLRVSIEENDLPAHSETADFADALFAAAEYNEPWEYDCTRHGGRYIRIRRQGGATALEIKLIDEVDEDSAEQEREMEGEVILLTPPLLHDLADAVRYLAEHPEATASSFTGQSLREAATEHDLRVWEAYEPAWE